MTGGNMHVIYGQKFPDSSAALPKSISAKIQPTIKRLIEQPDSPGLHVEKVDDDGLFSAHIDDDYRIIFSVPEGNRFLLALFAGPHEEACRFANQYKVETNPVTHSLQQVEKAPKRMVSESGTGKRLSRLAAVDDKRMVELGIPEEYWTQLREKVYTAGQLSAFKGLIPNEAYDAFEFILDGAPVDEAMEIWRDMTSTVTPAAAEEKKPLFADLTAEELISVGIPSENVDKVRRIRTDKELEIIAASLPILAQQSLYALKYGETVEEIRKTTFASVQKHQETDFESVVRSPLTLAEFAPIDSEEALKAIIEYPAEKWRVFLHPCQSEIIQQDFSGPARVVGGAGTGKTVVIVHRARRLASECADGEKILVTTYGNTLKYDIDERIHSLCSPQELGRIDVRTVDKLSYDLSKELLQRKILYDKELAQIWREAMRSLGLPGAFVPQFCVDEWRDVMQAQNIKTLEDYLNALRYGRGKRFERADREKFWTAAVKYMELCEQKGVTDAGWAQNRLAGLIGQQNAPQYRSVIVDECQDLRAPALRMLRALAGSQRKNDMYLSGDSRQRIYGGRVSLSRCGIVINNRSRMLKLNYRTTAEIYDFAMRLQAEYQYDDLDGRSLSRDQSTCIFHGPAPFIQKFDGPEQEIEAMVRDIQARRASGVPASELCVMARSNGILQSLRNGLEDGGLPVLMVTNAQPDDKRMDGVRLMTMHRGKGMEFSHVYLPCLRREVLPDKRDMKKAEDEDMRVDLMQSEANLLSVAITRAKRSVWLSYSGEPSELIGKYI